MVMLLTASAIWLLQHFVMGVYQASTALGNRIAPGQCVLVNRLSHNPPKRSELVLVWCCGSMLLAEVEAVSGDTICYSGKQWVIPEQCTALSCNCIDCHPMLVHFGAGRKALIHSLQVVGIATPLYVLPW